MQNEATSPQKVKRYTPQYKLDAVRATHAFGNGGVMAVSKARGIPLSTLSQWRKEEDHLREEVGETIVVRAKKPPNRRRILSVQEEETLAEWYKHSPGPKTQPHVVKKLREWHPNIFIQNEHDDEALVRKRASNWLYHFLKRNGLECKSRSGVVDRANASKSGEIDRECNNLSGGANESTSGEVNCSEHAVNRRV